MQYTDEGKWYFSTLRFIDREFFSILTIIIKNVNILFIVLFKHFYKITRLQSSGVEMKVTRYASGTMYFFQITDSVNKNMSKVLSVCHKNVYHI